MPDDTPYATGGIGLLGTKPSQDAMEGCDTLLIWIDLDPLRIGLRYTIDVGLVGDSRRTLSALVPLLQRKQDRGFLVASQEGMRDWRSLM